MTTLEIQTPRWMLPFLKPARYKGIKGGRASGKSHTFAEMAVEQMILDPYTDFVCLREVQKSLRHSAKKLIEQKIEYFGAQKHFRILDTEIRRLGTDGTNCGIMIFQGMADHTADSIKSLEGFRYAWFEEASRMTARSLELLRPTIREEGSELWFSWNPDQPTDPIEKFLVNDPPDNAIVAHLNYTENPFCPDVVHAEALTWQKHNPDTFGHVWMGDYNTKSDDQILGGKWISEDFKVQDHWMGPYYGADWGFSTDPNTLVEVFIDLEANKLYVRRELWGLHIEIDDTPKFFARMKGCENYTIIADNARPEMISYMKRPKAHGGGGYRKIVEAEKWPGSVEDGIMKLRSFDQIVLHTDCPKTQEECRLYKYKRDRFTDEVLPDVIKKHDHLIDAIRYAIEPFTKRARRSFWD